MGKGGSGASGFAGKLALLVLSVGFSLAAGECFVRSLSPVELGFRYDPGSGTFLPPSEYVRHSSTNSLGFHDVEHGPPRGGVARILILGDSYVHGYWGTEQETVGQRLQHHLRIDDATGHEVIALGKAGWSQRDELAALERFEKKIRPDLVLTVFLPFNDVAENSATLRRRTAHQLRRPGFVLRPGWTRHAADAMPLFFFRSSLLNQLISYRLAQSRLLEEKKTKLDPETIPLHYFVYRTPIADEAWREAWAITEELVVRTRDLARALGARYAVAAASTPHGIRGTEAGLDWLLRAYPAMAAFEWDLELPNRRMQEICERHGIPFVNLEPAFRKATAAGRVLHWPIDGHWNREGADFAAQLLAGFVLAVERDVSDGNQSS